MTTYYVNKSGSDANNGLASSTAKLTIGAGLALLANTDTLYIGSGLYNETNLSATEYGINIYADGVVTLDGTSLGTAVPFSYTSSTGSTTNRFYWGGATTGGRFIFKNYSATRLFSIAVDSANLASTAAPHTISDTIFIANGSTQNLGAIYSTAANCNLFVNNCVFSGNFYNGINFVNQISMTGDTVFKQNTFYGCNVGIAHNLAYPSSYIMNLYVENNIFCNCTTNIFMRLLSHLKSCNRNIQYGHTNAISLNDGVTTYSFADLQTNGFETLGKNQNPNFLNPTEHIFYLTTNHDMNCKVGAYNYGYTRGADYNPDTKWNITGTADNSGWYNPDSNVTENGNDEFELSTGTTGVIWSPVWDMGSKINVSQINLGGTEIFPTNVFDFNNSDVRPNYQTCEIRASDTTFDQDDVSPSFTEVKNNVPFTTVSGRYVQVRITFRNDGVAG